MTLNTQDADLVRIKRENSESLVVKCPIHSKERLKWSIEDKATFDYDKVAWVINNTDINRSGIAYLSEASEVISLRELNMAPKKTNKKVDASIRRVLSKEHNEKYGSDVILASEDIGPYPDSFELIVRQTISTEHGTLTAIGHLGSGSNRNEYSLVYESNTLASYEHISHQYAVIRGDWEWGSLLRLALQMHKNWSSVFHYSKVNSYECRIRLDDFSGIRLSKNQGEFRTVSLCLNQCPAAFGLGEENEFHGGECHFICPEGRDEVTSLIKAISEIDLLDYSAEIIIENPVDRWFEDLLDSPTFSYDLRGALRRRMTIHPGASSKVIREILDLPHINGYEEDLEELR